MQTVDSLLGVRGWAHQVVAQAMAGLYGGIFGVKGHDERALGDEILQSGKVLLGISAVLKPSNDKILKIWQAAIDHPRAQWVVILHDDGKMKHASKTAQLKLAAYKHLITYVIMACHRLIRQYDVSFLS